MTFVGRFNSLWLFPRWTKTKFSFIIFLPIKPTFAGSFKNSPCLKFQGKLEKYFDTFTIHACLLIIYRKSFQNYVLLLDLIYRLFLPSFWTSLISFNFEFSFVGFLINPTLLQPFVISTKANNTILDLFVKIYTSNCSKLKTCF